MEYNYKGMSQIHHRSLRYERIVMLSNYPRYPILIKNFSDVELVRKLLYPSSRSGRLSIYDIDIVRSKKPENPFGTAFFDKKAVEEGK